MIGALAQGAILRFNTARIAAEKDHETVAIMLRRQKVVAWKQLTLDRSTGSDPVICSNLWTLLSY